MTVPVGYLIGLALTVGVDFEEAAKFKCKDFLDPLPDVPPAPPKGYGPSYGYYHCQSMTESQEQIVRKRLNEEADQYHMNESQMLRWCSFDLEQTRDIARKDFGIMSAIKIPKDAFVIAGHGTSTHLVRWPKITLWDPSSEEVAQLKGYWCAEKVADHLKCHPSNASKQERLNSCAYVVVLACNTGNDIDPIIQGKKICFAQELANKLNKPCYAPQGTLFYTEDSEPQAYAEADHQRVSTTDPLVGAKRDFKMFYPHGYIGPQIPAPKTINLGAARNS